MKKVRHALIILLLSSLMLSEVRMGHQGTIELTVMNCDDGSETPTAYYYAEICNINPQGQGNINGSIHYTIRDESGSIVCDQCTENILLRPGECYTDTEQSCTFTSQGNKTFLAEYFEDPHCSGNKILDTDTTQCYFIPTLGKLLLSFLIITLAGISIYWWKRR